MHAVDALRRGVHEDVMPGATVCAFRKGQMFLHEGFGTLDSVRPTTTDTIYDLASLTKPMATASSILTLLEEGILNLSDKLPLFFGDAAKHLSDVSIRHLLTHTSGLPAWTACYKQGTGMEAALAAIFALPVALPGTKYEYSCLGYILLGRIVEILSERTLDIYVRENVFIPLGLGDTTFLPDPSVHDRIAPTKGVEGPEKPDAANPITLQGTVHDGNARGIGGVAGNAGLFGTARDVAAFGEAIRQGPHMAMTFGTSSGFRSGSAPSAASMGDSMRRGPATTSLFSAATFPRLLKNQVEPSVGAQTLMFFAHPNPLCPMGELLSNETVGHSGYTGTLITIDPALELVVVVLTNRVYTDLEGKNWLALRRRFLNMLAASVF